MTSSPIWNKRSLKREIGMPIYAYVVLAVGWLAWMMPFLLMKRNKAKAQQIDRRARWGILLELIAFSIVWQPIFWEISLSTWRFPLSIILFILASALSWTAARTLGRQWRLDAGLNAEHELITSGPYRFIRHPIYTSLLCLLWAMGFLFTLLPWLALASLLALIGTEIRVRVEDGLLASRFGKQFEAYQRSVPAYIPLIR
jgi:protein-S-isoprenylcysteine O-methyltransferase Ste14